MMHDQAIVRRESSIITIGSLDALEREFWEQTRGDNLEHGFITDGRSYQVTGEPRPHSVSSNPKVISNFARSSTDPLIAYHTHPHRCWYYNNKPMPWLWPPSLLDFVCSSFLRKSLQQPIITRLIERHGVWEYTTSEDLGGRVTDFAVEHHEYELRVAMNVYSGSRPIEEQVASVLAYFARDPNKKVSFRRI